MERAVYLVAGFFAALALTTGASGAGSSTPGVTSTQIVIGGTIPLSGVASAYQTVGTHLGNAQKKFEDSARHAGRVRDRFERIAGADPAPDRAVLERGDDENLGAPGGTD